MVLRDCRFLEYNDSILEIVESSLCGGPIYFNCYPNFPIFISKHYIGDPFHLKDKNSELLSNLKCKKLIDFKWYKDTFMTRIMQRTDNNQPFWREKFLAGLPIMLEEKLRNQIRETYKGIIRYEDLTYGELISFTQKEELKIYQDMKFQKQLKREIFQTRKELGLFYEQFDIRNDSKQIKCCQNKYQKKISFQKSSWK
ncbi:hypothetical protein REPUB_Repub16aG0025700 [Reevesia pubescens]